MKRGEKEKKKRRDGEGEIGLKRTERVFLVLSVACLGVFGICGLDIWCETRTLVTLIG